jgi:hypothetical protein
MLRTIVFACLSFGLAGCGGSGNAITDPADLPPLTAEHAAAIAKQDRQVEEEEQGKPVVTPGKARRARRTRAGD